MPYKDKDKQRQVTREWSRANRLATRLKAIEMLGGKCVNCYTDDYRVLQIDHIIPAMDRPLNRNGAYNAFQVVKGILASTDVQLLCANCHMIKTYEQDRKQFKNYISTSGVTGSRASLRN